MTTHTYRAADNFETWPVEREPGQTLDELARDQADEQASLSADWQFDRRGPYTITVSALDADGEEIDWASATVTVGPEIPACIADEHAWSSPHDIVGGLLENPGVCGNGGGVIIEEICSRCGCRRTENTWDQSWTGTGEPVTTVSYDDPDELTEAWAASEAVRRGDWDTLNNEWDLTVETLRISQAYRHLTHAEVWEEGDWDTPFYRPDARTAQAVFDGADFDSLAALCWEAWRRKAAGEADAS